MCYLCEAEVVILNDLVTGVQTCALPISEIGRIDGAMFEDNTTEPAPGVMTVVITGVGACPARTTAPAGGTTLDTSVIPKSRMAWFWPLLFRFSPGPAGTEKPSGLNV